MRKALFRFRFRLANEANRCVVEAGGSSARPEWLAETLRAQEKMSMRRGDNIRPLRAFRFHTPQMVD